MTTGSSGISSHSSTISICGREFDKSALVMTAIGIAILGIATILWITYVQNNNNKMQMQTQMDELDLKLKQIRQEIDQKIALYQRGPRGPLDVQSDALYLQRFQLQRAWEGMQLSPPPQGLYMTTAILSSLIGSSLVGCGVKGLLHRN